MNLENPDISLFRHRADIQLRFNDVDVLGHVNNTVYFSFYDTGKALYFTAVKGRQISWREVDRVIANIDCAFRAPIVYGEQIEVLTRCSHIGTKSFTLQQVLREKQTGEIKSFSTTVMVAYDPKKACSCEISPQTRAEIETYENLKFA